MNYKFLAFTLAFSSLSAVAGPAQEYQVCMKKFDAAQENAERMKMEYTSVCHFFYTSCSRRYWNGHPKPLVDEVKFVIPTAAHYRASAVVVEIGNECMALLDEMEKSEGE